MDESDTPLVFRVVPLGKHDEPPGMSLIAKQETRNVKRFSIKFVQI